jgi:large conductance mechanosensitive channel
MAQSGGFIKDFQKFIMQGNAIDLAVAFVIGAAFSKIVGALVEKVFMPIISAAMSIATPGYGWKQWMIPLGGTMKVADPDNAGKMIEVAQGIYIGELLASVVDFIAIGFVVFMLIRALEKFKRRFKRQEEVTGASEPTVEEQTLDALNRLTRALESRGM